MQGLVSQLVVPAALQQEVLYACHDDITSGHLGIFKTYEKLRERYYWRKMFKDTEHWVKSCRHCCMKKSPKHNRKAPLLLIPVEGAFSKLSVDVLGPFPVSA